MTLAVHRRSATRRRRLERALLIAPAALVVFGFVLLPFVDLLNLSLREGILSSFKAIGELPMSFANYASVLESPETWRSVRLSAVYTVGVALPASVVGVVLGLQLSSEQPWRKTFRAMALVPWAIPNVPATLIFLWMLNPAFGVVNHILRSLNIISGDPSWFTSPSTAMLAVILPTVWRALPFAVIITIAVRQGVPGDLYEASAADGASKWQQFRFVTWPWIRAPVAVATVLNGIWAFREFDFIYSATQGGPAGATETTSVLIYNKSFRYFEFGEAAALAVLTFGLVIVVVALLFGRMGEQHHV